MEELNFKPRFTLQEVETQIKTLNCNQLIAEHRRVLRLRKLVSNADSQGTIQKYLKSLQIVIENEIVQKSNILSLEELKDSYSL
jgi:hypothetical protein